MPSDPFRDIAAEILPGGGKLPTMNCFAAFLLTLASMGCTAHPTSKERLLLSAPPLMVGRGSGQIVLADVNRDRHLDVVTQHLLERAIAVQLGDGRGHFAALPDGIMTLGFEPGTMAVEDVSGDGLLDLLIASKDSAGEYVHVFLGDGTGRFGTTTGTTYAVSGPFRGYKPALRVVDVNEDGHPDILTVNSRRNSIATLLGGGRGTFSKGPVIRLQPGDEYYSFDIGDADGDQHLDLVTVSSGAGGRSSRIEVRRGDGMAGFGAAVSAPVYADPRLAALADVDGDRDSDIVLTHADKRQLSVLLNGGRGEFTPAPSSPHEISDEAFGLVVADANKDGRPDIFAATVNSIIVLLGDGKTFAQAPGSPFPAGPGAYNLAVGDIDEDGRVDVVASSFEGEAAAVLLTHGVGGSRSAE